MNAVENWYIKKCDTTINYDLKKINCLKTIFTRVNDYLTQVVN